MVPRQFPCDRKEAENLRDGPFSGFRASSRTFLEKESDGKTLEKEASLGANSREKGTLVVAQDEEDTEDESNESHSVVEEDEPAETEDDSGYVLGEEDDRSEPSQWQSDMLCVADPFIRAKVRPFPFVEMVELPLADLLL